MDEIMVGIIVTGAVIYVIKKMIQIYRGEKTCDCCSGSSCASKESCDSKLLTGPEK